jgi:integrase
MPKYEPDQRQIRIPTKEKLEMLIANSGRRMATKLQLSLETGIRPIELCNLKVKDVDLEQRIVYPTTAKHGQARTLKISAILQNMLMDYIARDKLKPDDKLFNTNARGYSKMFRMTRNALAIKLHDPTIKQIRLYDFRHFFATNLYHKTRDILLVMKQLGHRNIENTLVYTQLLNLQEDEWTCKTATNVKEATELIEAGFEYIQEIDGIRLYRKRK